MAGYLEATANYLYGWGDGWLEEEKPIYTKRMRKTKIFIAGFTTFLSIVNIVADWYNFSFFALQTRHKLIETNATITDSVFISVAVLCGISTLLVCVELVAFVLQFRDARNYVTTRTRSEALEESVSYLLLVIDNTLIPLTFALGYLLGACAVAAQIRSFPARIALVVSGISAIWRLIQSFAYCCHCKYESCAFMFCQWLRYVRGFFILSSLCVILFLLSVSLSLRASVDIDKYIGKVEDKTHYSDTVNGVYLYQRFVAPYQITPSQRVKDCGFFETRIQFAEPNDFKNIHDKPYYIRLHCADVSEFYDSLIRNKHRSLAITYDCHVIIGIQDSDFRAARIINAGYELQDPDSSTCVSGHVELEFDYLYDVSESHKIDLGFLFTNRTIHGLTSELCDNSCPATLPPLAGDGLMLNCSASHCVSDADTPSGGDIGHMSTVLVPERELMSMYPCMSQILIDESFELPLCTKSDDVIVANMTSAMYTTCQKPFITQVPRDTRQDWIKQENIV